MITFKVVLLFTFAIYTKQQTTMDPTYAATVLQYRTDCMKENGIEIAEISKIWTDPNYPANNEPLKCYYKCMANKLGIIDDGKYDAVDGAKVFVHYNDADGVKEINTECANLAPNKDECEYAYQLYKCIAEAQLD